jgi:CHAT domain-containing protein
MTYGQLLRYYRKNGFMDKADALEAECDPPSTLDKKPYEHPYYWAGYILQGDISNPI